MAPKTKRPSFLLFCGVAIIYALRVNLAVAIIPLTDKSEPYYDTYDWDQITKALILSSSFLGYLFNKPSGQFTKQYGFNNSIMFAVMISSVLTLFTQLAIAYCDWLGLITIRFCMGLVESVTYPSARELEENSSVFVCSGMTFGYFVMFLLSGISASYLGWPSVFYLSGGIGIIWSILWKLSTSTKYFGISSTNYKSRTEQTESKYHVTTPSCLKYYLTSIPFNALLIAQCCQMFVFTILLNELPSYLNGVYGFSIRKSAYLSSFPYVGSFLMEYVFVKIKHQVSNNTRLSKSFVRKAFNSIGQFIPGIGLAYLGFKSYLVDDEMIVVVVLILSLSANVAIRLGIHVNHIDLSRNHSDELKYICDFCGNMASAFAMIVVGYVVSDVENADEWKSVFAMSSVVMCFGGLVFVIFGSTKAHDCNELKTRTVQV